MEQLSVGMEAPPDEVVEEVLWKWVAGIERGLALLPLSSPWRTFACEVREAMLHDLGQPALRAVDPGPPTGGSVRGIGI